MIALQKKDCGIWPIAVDYTLRRLAAKLDFTNAFNSVRMDTICISVADKMPELYRFVHASLDCSPKLSYGNDIIASTEGSQQGDPLSNVEYCNAVQPTLVETTSRTKLGYVNDTNLEGRISAVANDVQHIIDSFPTTGLILNAHKCEIIANNFYLIKLTNFLFSRISEGLPKKI